MYGIVYSGCWLGFCDLCTWSSSSYQVVQSRAYRPSHTVSFLLFCITKTWGSIFSSIFVLATEIHLCVTSCSKKIVVVVVTIISVISSFILEVVTCNFHIHYKIIMVYYCRYRHKFNSHIHGNDGDDDTDNGGDVCVCVCDWQRWRWCCW